MTTDATMTTCQQNCLDAATALAAEGKYESALELLRGVTLPALGVAAAVLRAKVYAQLSKYADAEQAWEQALSLAPDNEEAQRGLELTKKLREKGRGRLFLRARLYYGVFAALLVVLAGLAAFVLARGPAAGPEGGREQGLALVEEELRTTREVVEAMQASIAAADKRSQETTERLEAVLALAGDVDSWRARQEDLSGSLVERLQGALDTRDKDLAKTLAEIDERVARLEEQAGAQGEAMAAMEKGRAADREAAAKELTAVRESLSSAEGDLGGIAEAVERTSRHVGNLDGSLSEEIEELKEGVRYVLEALAPDGAQSYPAEMEELRQSADRLRSELEEGPGDGLSLLSPLKRRVKAARLEATEDDLKEVEAAYEEEVAPWRRAMDAVGAPEGVPAEAASTEGE